MDASGKVMDGENDRPSLRTGCGEYGGERMPPAVALGRVVSWACLSRHNSKLAIRRFLHGHRPSRKSWAYPRCRR